eukprot:3300272-Prymnesium_polylepis.1
MAAASLFWLPNLDARTARCWHMPGCLARRAARAASAAFIAALVGAAGGGACPTGARGAWGAGGALGGGSGVALCVDVATFFATFA